MHGLILSLGWRGFVVTRGLSIHAAAGRAGGTGPGVQIAHGAGDTGQ